MYEKFHIIQNQCETKWIRDTRDYLDFSDKFVTFIREYTEVFLEEYMKKSMKNFDQFFANEMRQPLENKKEEVRDLYLGLQKKLKPSYGHPNNRNLLEKLEIEAQITEIQARDILDDDTLLPMNLLRQKFDTIVEEFYTLNNSVPEVEEIPNVLKVTGEDLYSQLREKVLMLKTFVSDIDKDVSGDFNEAVISHCKSFLVFYEEGDSQEGSSLQVSPSITIKSEFTDKTVSTKSTSLSKTPGESTVILSMEDVDVFLTDLKEIYDKCVKELEAENFDIFVEKRKTEWNYAVKTVLDLYKVKYDV